MPVAMYSQPGTTASRLGFLTVITWRLSLMTMATTPMWLRSFLMLAQAPSGTNLDGCQAIHAEQNALLQCRDMYAIHTAYVTASPCMTCCKLLLNTSCQRIVYVEEYPHSAAKDLWTGAGRSWEQLLVEL